MGLFAKLTKCLFCYEYPKKYNKKSYIGKHNGNVYIEHEMMKLYPMDNDSTYEQYVDSLLKKD